MNTMASLSLIRPQLVSLWDGPLSKTPRPPLEGPRRGLSRDLRVPFFLLPISLSSHPPQPDNYQPLTAVPLVTSLFPSGDAKKGPVVKLGRLGSRKREKGEKNIDGKMEKKEYTEIGRRRRGRIKEGTKTEKNQKWSRGISGYFLCNPLNSPPSSPFAPTDRTHWPVFNKAPVLGRFFSSSINCSGGVTQGRERAREIESMRERQIEMEGKRRRKVKRGG